MMKKLAIGLALMLLCGSCWGVGYKAFTAFDGDSCKSTDTTWSDTLDIGQFGWFGGQYIIASTAGVPAIELVYFCSMWEDSGFAQPSSNSIEDSLTVETWNVKSITPPPFRYMVIRARGLSANQADTAVWAYLWTWTN